MSCPLFPITFEISLSVYAFRHAKLNDYDGIEYIDEAPPQTKGEEDCHVYPCPVGFEKDIICWKCRWFLDDPIDN